MPEPIEATPADELERLRDTGNGPDADDLGVSQDPDYDPNEGEELEADREARRAGDA